MGAGTGTAGRALKNALLAEEDEDAILSWCTVNRVEFHDFVFMSHDLHCLGKRPGSLGLFFGLDYKCPLDVVSVVERI